MEAVALASIALAATAMGGNIWLAKYLAKTLSHDLKEHTKAAVEQTAASREATTFLRKLNGQLPKLVEEKKKEARDE